MPSRAEHIAKAEANEQVAHLLQAVHPDWAVTALFYAAVHWVDAVLDGLDETRVHPRSHAQRRGYIARRPELAVIEADYTALQDASVGSRYDCEVFETADVAHLWETRYAAARQVCEAIVGRSSQGASPRGA